MIGGAHAKTEQRQKAGAAELGLEDEILHHLKSGNRSKAKKVADENDIEHTISDDEDPGEFEVVDKTKSNTASAHARKTKSASSAHCSMVKLRGGSIEDWAVCASMWLRGSALSLNDFVMMDDVMGPTWNGSIWAGKGESEVDHSVTGDVPSTSQKDHTNDGATAATISFKEGGLFGDDDYSDQSMTMNATLERIDSSPTGSGVTFYYYHTGSKTALGSVDVSVSASGISVNTGGGKTFWRAFDDGDP